MKLATASIIRELDKRAMEEYGISGAVLMENAGSGIAEMLFNKFLEAKDKGVVVVCGSGNNGGDGFVIARHLHNFGVEVDVFVAGKAAKVKDGESRTNLEIIKKMGIGVAEIVRDEDLLALTRSLSERGVVVDALLGTGIEREVEGMYARIIMAINDISADKDKKVLSVDIPSGIDSDSGNVLGVAILADATIALALPKLGEVVYPGADYAGELYLLDISIPKKLVERMEIDSNIVVPADFFSLMVKRSPQTHKGDFGHLLIIAGSPGKTGAATLATNGALLTGTGLVTVGVPASLNDIMESKTTAAMTLPLPNDENGFLSSSALLAVIENIVDNSSAIAVGPGLGTSKGVREVVRGLIEKSEIPLVIDADGLNVISDDPDILKKKKANVIITPHPGEMGRLIGKGSGEVQANRAGVARDFAKEYGVWVVLKGARTIIAVPDGEIFVATCGNPGMARGGVGDILTGLIGGFLAMGKNPTKAACAGVYIHGRAGDAAADCTGVVSLSAADILDKIPKVTAGLYNSDPVELETRLGPSLYQI